MREQLPDDYSASSWQTFARSLNYFTGDVTALDDVERLASHLDELDGKRADRILYLSTAPARHTAPTHPRVVRSQPCWL